MGKMGIIIYPNGNALFAASLGTNPGTFSKFGGNKCAQTLKNEYMKTSIYLRKTKKGADEMTLCIRIRQGKLDLRAVTPLSVISQFWDCRKQCYKPNTPVSVIGKDKRVSFNKEVGRLLAFVEESVSEEADADALKEAIARFFAAPEKQDITPEQRQTPAAVEERMSVLEGFQRYLGENDFSSRHISETRCIERKIKRYIEWQRRMNGIESYEMFLDDLDPAVLSNFREFAASEHLYFREFPDFYEPFKLRACNMTEISPNTLTALMARLTFVLNWCVKRGYMTNESYRSFDHGVLVYGSPYYLTIEERDAVYNADLTGWPQQLIEHRDKFMFQCLMGCRYGDLQRLTKDNIVDGFLEYYPQKSLRDGKGGVVRVPLNEKAKAILARQKTDGNRLFPKHCRQSYNSDIKLLLHLLGVNRMVTVLNRYTHENEQHPICELASSHLARRTFIGNLYKKVKDQELVASLTGHSPGSKAFARYRTIDEDMKKEIIDKIN